MNAAQAEHAHMIGERELDRLQALLLSLPTDQQRNARLFTLVTMKAFRFAVRERTTIVTLRTMMHFLEHHLAVIDEAADSVGKLG